MGILPVGLPGAAWQTCLDWLHCSIPRQGSPRCSRRSSRSAFRFFLDRKPLKSSSEEFVPQRTDRIRTAGTKNEQEYLSELECLFARRKKFKDTLPCYCCCFSLIKSKIKGKPSRLLPYSLQLALPALFRSPAFSLLSPGAIILEHRTAWSLGKRDSEGRGVLASSMPLYRPSLLLAAALMLSGLLDRMASPSTTSPSLNSPWLYTFT